MELKKLCTRALILPAVLATSCVDSNYDLSDIDTTVQLNVDNLTVPIDIDEISMKSIFDLKEDGSIQLIDDVYTYTKAGDFKSDNIKIDAIKVTPGKIDQVALKQSLPSLPGALPQAIDIPLDLTFGDEALSRYSFKAQNITNDIQGLTRIEGNFNASLKLQLTGLENAVSKVGFTDFKFQLPKGLEIDPEQGTSYDSATGVFTINRPDQPLSFTIKVNAGALNLDADVFDAQNHTIDFSGEAGIIGGQITMSAKAGATMPSEFGILLNIEFPQAVEITAIDGMLQHKIDNLNIPDIDISNLPDILNKPGTNLIMTNPCIYVRFNNPMAVCSLAGEAGLTIYSIKGDVTTPHTIDDGTFAIAADPMDYFCFSPKKPDKYMADYQNAVHVPFSSLSYILSGDGLPSKLRVSITDPQLPLQSVKGLLLGHDYGNIHGVYDLVAPLQLSAGSQIVYTDRIDGWHKDVKDITVTSLQVTLNVTTDIPLGASFTAYPIDVNGNRMAGVTVESTEIAPNASSQEVTVKITGTIKDLDGVEFTATAKAADGNALNSGMHILLKDIRPCISGYYTKEL